MKSWKERLKDLKDKREKGCVAFAKFRGVTYYALNGDSELEAKTRGITKIIKDISKGDCVRCTYDYAYTIINPAQYSYFEINKDFLSSQFEKTGIMILGDIIFPMKSDSTYLDRNWSCCERKIVGYLFDKKKCDFYGRKSKNNHDIVLRFYATRKPCPLCLPFMHYGVALTRSGKTLEKYEYNHRMIGIDQMEITRK